MYGNTIVSEMRTMTDNWQPIATAPKDGTVIVLHNLGGRRAPQRRLWNAHFNEWIAECPILTGGDDNAVLEPSHWRAA